MDFSSYQVRQRKGENIVPMINVVFLLLIFFLMSAQIAPRDLVDIVLPESASDAESPSSDSLYLDADGGLYFEDVEGEAVWMRIAERNTSDPLFIRADQAVPASKLAALLPKLAAAGVTETLLVTGRN